LGCGIGTTAKADELPRFSPTALVANGERPFRREWFARNTGKTKWAFRAFLPPQFRELLEATEEPFAQPIRDLAVPQCFLAASCLWVKQPLWFALTPQPAPQKAAADGMMLGQALRDGDSNLAKI